MGDTEQANPDYVIDAPSDLEVIQNLYAKAIRENGDLKLEVARLEVLVNNTGKKLAEHVAELEQLRAQTADTEEEEVDEG